MKLKRPLVLASSSPRRQYLMREAGFEFTIEKPGVEETYPPDLPVHHVARYLAAVKAEFFRPSIHDQIVVTADTVVILDNQVLNKPVDRTDAIRILTSLSGQTHKVMTGVSIVSKEKEECFDVTTAVTFHPLTTGEIEAYIDQFKPYDKAGAYGAQDCLPAGVNPCSKEEIEFLRDINRIDLIEGSFTMKPSGVGMVAIKEIEGSYFNVMGLPLHIVYDRLKHWD